MVLSQKSHALSHILHRLYTQHFTAWWRILHWHHPKTSQHQKLLPQYKSFVTKIFFTFLYVTPTLHATFHSLMENLALISSKNLTSSKTTPPIEWFCHKNLLCTNFTRSISQPIENFTLSYPPLCNNETNSLVVFLHLHNHKVTKLMSPTIYSTS